MYYVTIYVISILLYCIKLFEFMLFCFILVTFYCMLCYFISSCVLLFWLISFILFCFTHLFYLVLLLYLIIIYFMLLYNVSLLSNLFYFVLLTTWLVESLDASSWLRPHTPTPSFCHAMCSYLSRPPTMNYVCLCLLYVGAIKGLCVMLGPAFVLYLVGQVRVVFLCVVLICYCLFCCLCWCLICLRFFFGYFILLLNLVLFGRRLARLGSGQHGLQTLSNELVIVITCKGYD